LEWRISTSCILQAAKRPSSINKHYSKRNENLQWYRYPFVYMAAIINNLLVSYGFNRFPVEMLNKWFFGQFSVNWF
jgi:hypothetical protein